MSETLIPAQGPVDVLVGRLRTHAEATPNASVTGLAPKGDKS